MAVMGVVQKSYTEYQRRKVCKSSCNDQANSQMCLCKSYPENNSCYFILYKWKTALKSDSLTFGRVAVLALGLGHWVSALKKRVEQRGRRIKSFHHKELS